MTEQEEEILKLIAFSKTSFKPLTISFDIIILAPLVTADITLATVEIPYITDVPLKVIIPPTTPKTPRATEVPRLCFAFFCSYYFIFVAKKAW